MAAFPNLIDLTRLERFLDNIKTLLNAKADTSDIPTASSSTPIMDGTAAVGTSTAYARADHVHPSDTTKAGVRLCAWAADTEETS